MSLTMTDIFCGGGGSSTGGMMVRGVKVVMAANHNTLAVNTSWTSRTLAWYCGCALVPLPDRVEPFPHLGDTLRERRQPAVLHGGAVPCGVGVLA